MIDRQSFRTEISNLYLRIRTEKGLSRSKMADLLGIDSRTYTRYETGESIPPVDDFVVMFDAIGLDAMRLVLEILFPTIYQGLNRDSDTKALRDATAHYITTVASDRTVNELSYLMFGRHGSNFVAQLQEFTAIDHLPMEYRFFIATHTLLLWELVMSRGELVNTDDVMPDIQLLRDGIAKGHEAVLDGRNSYTTSTTKK